MAGDQDEWGLHWRTRTCEQPEATRTTPIAERSDRLRLLDARGARVAGLVGYQDAAHLAAALEGAAE